MARRTRKTLWTRSFGRTLGAFGRASWRNGVRAMADATARALRPAVAPAKKVRAAKLGPSHWVTGVAVGATGARRYRLCIPPLAQPAAPLPLLVMLHGCDQDATGFARSTRLQALAARDGFMLLFPEQERLANPHRCWNWFDLRAGRAHAEAASIVAAIDQACATHGADRARVAVAGLSAGACMAALLGVRYPERFKAVAMHSGVGPGAARSTATALAAMQARRAPSLPLGNTSPLPPLLVIQGDADPVVRPANGRAAAELWADAADARAGLPRTVQRGARRAMTVTDFKRHGHTVATLCEVAGLGHAWSGGAASEPYGDASGPDASRLILAFAARQFMLGDA
jgi:poly(hydroxyalkanoate) depolymerase family esterase